MAGTDEIMRPGSQVFDVSRTTFVRLGTVFACVWTLWTAYKWLDDRFSALEKNLDAATRRIEAASSDRWTRTEQRLFILELKLRNPKMDVPPIESVSR